MTTHAYLALVACPHESRGVFFGISGGLRGRGGSLLPKVDKSRAAARKFSTLRLAYLEKFSSGTLTLRAPTPWGSGEVDSRIV